MIFLYISFNTPLLIDQNKINISTLFLHNTLSIQLKLHQ